MAQGRLLQSVFFGGGTPSLFSANGIGDILRSVEQQIGFADDIEITLETNPGTAEYDNLLGYRQAGVNRLSFGVQSFHDHLLKNLGRIHSADEAKQAFVLARRAGFDNINLDLMHGLPQQSLEEALSDLQQACALAPEHLSWYQLTIEPNTVFHNRPPKLPEELVLEEIGDLGQVYLAQQGYAQYEISAYARAARQSRHNLNYWQFGDYLAIGAGAHGKITYPNGTIERLQKTRMPTDYLEATQPLSKRQTIASSELGLEFMMNALRLNQGVDADLFTRRTGLSLESQRMAMQSAVAQGLLVDNLQRIQTTERGRLFLNDTLALFS